MMWQLTGDRSKNRDNCWGRNSLSYDHGPKDEAFANFLLDGLKTCELQETGGSVPLNCGVLRGTSVFSIGLLPDGDDDENCGRKRHDIILQQRI